MFSKRKDIIMKWEQRWVFCFRFWFLSWDIVALGLEHWTPIWGFRFQTWPGHLFQEGEEKWYSQSLHAMETGIGSSCMIVQLDILISIDLTFFFFFLNPYDFCIHVNLILGKYMYLQFMAFLAWTWKLRWFLCVFLCS